jgi:hypothetical protein
MTKKIGRNDICPCGSGLKYKKCCLVKEIIRYADNDELANYYEESALLDTLRSMTNTQKITDDDDKSFYRIFWDDKVEKVNPIEYYKNFVIGRKAISYRDFLEIKNPNLSAKLSDDFFIRFAKEKLEEEKFWEIKEQTDIHENFLQLLKTTRKKGQESLLKGLSINTDQLIVLIFKSYRDYGYLYSRYRFENLPKGLEDKRKPKLADISEDGVIKTIGETDLTEGEVKRMIEQRKVIIAHFFDKSKEWHCLFTTYNSIEGKENWKGGQSHFHYISSAFGVERNEFIESMRKGTYKSTSIHIDLLDYGNQII